VRPRKFTDSNYVRAFREIVVMIGQVAGGAPLRMFVAGGAALHFYTGERISGDIDAALSRRVIAGDDLEVSYVDAAGTPRLLYFDTQYNETFALVRSSCGR